AEVVEQQERVEVIDRPRADAPLELHAGSLEHRLRFDDRFDSSRLAHLGRLPPAGRGMRHAGRDLSWMGMPEAYAHLPRKSSRPTARGPHGLPVRSRTHGDPVVGTRGRMTGESSGRMVQKGRYGPGVTSKRRLSQCADRSRWLSASSSSPPWSWPPS